MADGPSYIDETHQRIAEFADAFIPEEERGDFVNHFMEQAGYQPTVAWAPPVPEPGQGGAPWQAARPQGQQGAQGGRPAGRGQGGRSQGQTGGQARSGGTLWSRGNKG